ncbi:MAG: M20/M25/M40 family metallo-hydrolase [Alphaproteobacteria bacterium]|nr:MAG: M20/M25/M40 family metallo-hydrolase [Alphaproteobacteria bacterium]
MRHLLASLTLATVIAIPAFAAEPEPVDFDMVNRIRDEGFNHSQVMETLEYMTDVIGPRLTGSPALRRANDWTRDKFSEWGLKNAHLEGFEFGRGWSFSKSVVRMVAPREAQLYALPLSWHPGTNGVIRGEAIKAIIKSEKDFEKFKGKLKGKIVLLSDGGKPSIPDKPLFRRLSAEELAKREAFRIPDDEPDRSDRFAKIFHFQPKLYAFLKEEGALAVVRRSPRDAALIEASAYMHKTGESPDIPAVAMSSEDYRRLLRLIEHEQTVELEMEVVARYYDDDPKAYNTIAEIPGRGRNPQVVMAGAHLDSWFVGDGAVDNGVGSAIVMEAARILSALKVKPRRTIRFALWGGEEQGLYGSAAYVQNHFGTRPPPADEEKAKLPSFFWFSDTYPVTTKPEHEKLSVYFNIDNGSGRIRGIYGEGNAAAAPIFERWFTPFHDLAAETITLNKTGGTDHLYFQWVGLPAYQFIQDPLDYGARLHHTQIDTFDHVQAKDAKQAAVILASFLYHAAMREERFPRTPLPHK